VLGRRLIAAGCTLIAVGLLLQVQMPWLIELTGLGGSVFGLATKIGGPMVFAGLFALAMRPARAKHAAGHAPAA
jgi:hypothetical protein